MNDAPTKDPAGNNFPDFHRDHLKALEGRIVNLFEALEDRVRALEAAHPEDLKDVAQHVTDIFVMLAMQRAVNKAILEWGAQVTPLSVSSKITPFDILVAAIRETLE
jgi:hypothetical protein